MQETAINLFIARAEAAAAQVHAVPDEAAAAREVEAIRAEKGADGGAHGVRALPGGVGVVRAAKGIAQTGTCIVVTDDESLRLETMLPEVSVILLNSADILPDFPPPRRSFVSSRRRGAPHTFPSSRARAARPTSSA